MTQRPSEIESISPREHVQLRYYVYAGDCSDATQLMIELLGNSVDEFNIGYGNQIAITVDNDNHIYSIQDFGRGFPINETRSDGETTLQASYDVLNTSGKFREDGSYSGVSIGKNGQGGKISNFLSKTFDVLSWRGQDSEHVYFEDGVFVKRDLQVETPNAPSGTIINFVPSEKYFTSPTVNLARIQNFCDDITCLCKGLSIVLNEKNYQHDNGIVDMLNKNVGDSLSILQSPITESFEEGKQKMSFAMTYTSSSVSKIISYVNCGDTSSGPHLSAIKSCLTRVLNSWAREHNVLKKNDKNLDGQSLQEGLVFVSNITAEKVEYDAQIKTTVTKIDTQFISKFATFVEVWLDSNPADAQNVIERALIARKAAEAAKKAREAVKQKAAGKTKKKFLDMPTTLVDCKNKDRSQCDLIVVEGKSAASSLVAQRNASTVAVYSVRGMMLNLLKCSPDKILQNKEINNLVTALGLDYDTTKHRMIFDKSKLRYGRIIAASDADAAGAEIENLFFNILWKLCPELILNGYVYSAEPPLFRATLKDNSYHFLADQKALSEFQKRHKDIKEIHRAKGLAEQLPEQLAESLLNEETRKMRKLTVSDIEKTNKFFEDLYGKEVRPRVEYINENPWNVQVDYE